MRTFFHLPSRHQPTAARHIAWRDHDRVELIAGGKTATAQAWIYQTWMHLKKSGADVEMVENLPQEGIAITLNGWLPPHFLAPRDLFVAGLVTDGMPHAGVDLQIVQNAWHAGKLPSAIFMPHWPQPGLIPRDPERGARLESVCFFGDPNNLAVELRDSVWQEGLEQTIGARFEIRGAERWHDYRDVDAIVAVREFGAGRQMHKPATKLYNAWLAGVPMIAGIDSAYLTEGSPGQDYLQAASAEEVVAQLCRLRDEPRLREAIVAGGRKKSLAIGTEPMIRRWRELVDSLETQRRHKVRKSVFRRAIEHQLKRILFAADALRHRG
jgi:hypothetical protein